MRNKEDYDNMREAVIKDCKQLIEELTLLENQRNLNKKYRPDPIPVTLEKIKKEVLQ